MKSFWDSLPKPFFALAPLANVTDAAFRRIIAKYSKPGVPFVMYTEFVSADGLMKGNREVLLKDLLFTESERPIVAQFFTADIGLMEQAAALAQKLGFDGVDINMGCPDRSVEKQGAGAKLILNPKLAQELIAAAKRGAPNLPISVKTRLGYNKDVLEEWLPALLQARPAAIALHARTRKEMSKAPAHWERVVRAVEMRNELKSKTLIIGNGDVKDLDDARARATETGADGIMLGRAIFGRPWLFAEPLAEYFSKKSSDLLSAPQPGAASQTFFQNIPPSVRKRLRMLVEHTKLFEELLGDVKNFAIMKKHFKAYAEGFPGAKELRMQLMEAENGQQVEKIVENFIVREESTL
jgi:nifR3 family TIM-barrel protein